MIFNISFSGIQCTFEHFIPNSFLDTWLWKLDPWKIPHLSNESGIVSVKRTETQPLKDESLSLLSCETTGFFERRVYSTNSGTQWDFVRTVTDEVLLSYRVNKEWNSIELLQDNTHTKGIVTLEYLAQIMPGICLKHDVISFHCALIEYEGNAVAVCAPSGTGKTTHARLWRDYKNALILNGDRALCKKEDKTWMAYGSPWSGTSGEQINRKAPLKALVILERADNNEVVQLNSIEIFQNIFPHLVYPSWDRELLIKAMDQLDDLINNVPVYKLKCKPDYNAVDTLYDAIWEK